MAGPAPAPNSVAVLYFENLGRDTADAYIADGLTEEVTARLGPVSRLTVTSRTAVRRLRNTVDMETGAIGQALHATYLVSGSVRRAGSRLRVTVELVRATNGVRVWGDQFDGSDADLLSIQEEIARAVATGITGRLLPAEAASLTVRPTRSPEAYDHFLRGNRVMGIINPNSLAPAIGEFEAALRLDPGFTRARAHIAMAYAVAINWNWATPDIPAESLLARGVAAAARAVREAPTSADAWVAQGVIQMYLHPRAFEGATDALRRALALDSGLAAAHAWLATALRRLGQLDAAETEYRLATAADPTDPDNFSDRSLIALILRRYAEAVRLTDSAQVRDSTRWQNLIFRVRAKMGLGDTAGALMDARRAVRVSSGQRTALAVLAQAEGWARDTARARARLEPVVQPFATGDIPVRDGYEIALALIATGQRERTLEFLERVRPRGAWLWSYLSFPGFDAVRGDPRFKRLYDEMRPPDAQHLPFETP